MKLTTKEICHRMYLYFISYDDRGAPSFDKFACSIGMTLADLMKLRSRKKFNAAYRECCAIRRDYLIDRALDKRFDPSFVKQLLILGDGEDKTVDAPDFNLVVEVSE